MQGALRKPCYHALLPVDITSARLNLYSFLNSL